MKGVCDTCLGLAHKLLPEFVHAVYLVMLSYPNALPHPNCFPSIYAYSKVNLRSFSAADRPSDDLTVEADREQAPGVKGNCYKACCAVRPLPLALTFCMSECLSSTYSYGYASQQLEPAHNAEVCSDGCAALIVVDKPCGT